MKQEFITWNCPQCGSENHDYNFEEIYCSYCNEMVYVIDKQNIDDLHCKMYYQE